MVVPIVFVVVLLGLSELPRRQLEAVAWVNHTLEVLTQTATLEADLARTIVAAESFLLDRDAEGRDRFDAGVAQVAHDVAAVRELSADNPVQQSAIRILADLIDTRLAWLRDDMGRGGLASLHPARALAQRIGQVIGDMKEEERRLLAERNTVARDASRRIVAGLVACGIAAAGCACVVAWLLHRSRTRERAHLAALRQINGGLEDMVAARTAELSANRSRLGVYVDQLGDGLIAMRVEPGGRFVYEEVNAAARTMLGIGAEVIGREVHDVWPAAQARVTVARMKRCVADRAPLRYSTHVDTRVGPRELRMVMAPVADADGTDADEGRIALLLMSLRDVTRELALEAQLRQAQRMEAVGQLTAGVAHDFNNHLQTILGSLSVLRERPHLDAEARHCVAMAEKAARHGTTLTHRLLSFSRKQTLDPVSVDAEKTLSEVAGLLGQTLGGSVRVQTSVGPDVWRVSVDDAQLENCLLNLSLNARDAMQDGGLVRLAAVNRGPEAAASANLPPGDYVCFTVADEGEGMSPETLQRAFEPFYTTKEVGKGTGLGLSMVLGFARQSGGDVLIDSVQGVGTTISLWLPRSEGPREPAMQADTPAEDVHGHGRVLVVDDDPAVAQTLSLFLRKGGFSPIVVTSADAALQMLGAGAACDLLVADQSMPVMTGSQLIEAVAQLRPELPAMLVSGYDMESEFDEHDGRVAILRKPFERQAFLRLVQKLLASVAAS